MLAKSCFKLETTFLKKLATNYIPFIQLSGNPSITFNTRMFKNIENFDEERPLPCAKK
jgi:hypothetical protein